MVFYPCSLFENKNLYHLAEMVGAGMTLVGNILAFVGSVSTTLMPNKQGIVNVIGVGFVCFNVIFIVVFMYGYHIDIRRSEKLRRLMKKSKRKSSFASEFEIDRTNAAFVTRMLGEDVISSVDDWEGIVASIEQIDGLAKIRLVDGLAFSRSLIISSVRKELQQIEDDARWLYTKVDFESVEDRKEREARVSDLRIKFSCYIKNMEHVNEGFAKYTGVERDGLDGLEGIIL
ncbi:hypothetical protein TrVE_jg3179 [Triparma verrucosa]|uniref:Uncharacterized protein n=1 Tax=Triparma verrucosa TaxID=1606542 RepID=A0A9W7EZU1_9STRA|nr:hypothetical protein TrVE_jg3179 [Triparma verrucosa]